MASVDYLNRIRDLKKPEYVSQFGGVIGGLMDKIVNRQPFSYDFNADPIYQQHKDQYIKLGKEAAMNAVANASALTGGYGNSYAVTAGAQANQQALSGLNDIIPQLLNSAQKKYDSDTNALLTQYDIYNQAEQNNYNKFRDQMSDYNNERAYLTGMYNDALAQENYEKEQAEEQRRYEANLALQMAKNASRGSGKSSAINSGALAGALGTLTQTPKPSAELEDPVAWMKADARNKAKEKAQVQSTNAKHTTLINQAVNVFNRSRDVNQVENLLQSQVDEGKLTKVEAVDLLDDIIKRIR